MGAKSLKNSSPHSDEQKLKAVAQSPWAPLGQRPFAVLWCATVVSNMGTWMHDVGAGWLMTTMNPSPSYVAAVQAATALPVVLFAQGTSRLTSIRGISMQAHQEVCL